MSLPELYPAPERPDRVHEEDDRVEPHRVIVSAEGVSKKFRLFKERNQTLKAAILRGHRIVAEDFWAVRDVTFDVYEGETFGLIGENGSGKSTMLKCLTKIYQPDEGRVSVAGKISALLELGAGFHPELTGRENVFLNGAILGLGQRELRRRFDEIVDFAGIGPFIDEPVKNYSSGMYVRLGFSVAINVDPDVLLVDEVLAVGDEAFQRKCNEKFAEMKSEGKTVVLVSHAMGSVENLCDRVAWFEHGKLMQVGKPHDVISAYVSTTRVDRQIDEEGNERWGTGEGRITKVELLGALGRPLSHIRTGDPVTLRLHYELYEPIEQPVFGWTLFTLEGQLVAGSNTRVDGLVPDTLSGEGTIDVHFPELLLLPKSYAMHIWLTDWGFLHHYDYRVNTLRFDIESGIADGQAGVVALGGEWDFPALRSEV